MSATSPINVSNTRQVIGGSVIISHASTAGNKHLPSGGSSAQVLIGTATSGQGSWSNNIQTTGTASFASITASAGFTSSTGNIAVGGSITSS
ncbi:MAG: hypothetical protein WC175_04700 [Candidatus Dojkabacteria bacterium]